MTAVNATLQQHSLEEDDVERLGIAAAPNDDVFVWNPNSMTVERVRDGEIQESFSIEDSIPELTGPEFQKNGLVNLMNFSPYNGRIWQGALNDSSVFSSTVHFFSYPPPSFDRRRGSGPPVLDGVQSEFVIRADFITAIAFLPDFVDRT